MYYDFFYRKNDLLKKIKYNLLQSRELVWNKKGNIYVNKNLVLGARKWL